MSPIGALDKTSTLRPECRGTVDRIHIQLRSKTVSRTQAHSEAVHMKN
jgi:hypothetical protein